MDISNIKWNVDSFTPTKTGGRCTPNRLEFEEIPKNLIGFLTSKKFTSEDFFQYTGQAQRKILNNLLNEFKVQYKLRNNHKECKFRMLKYLQFFNLIGFRPFTKN